MKRSMLVAVVVGCVASATLAQDASVLSGRDDVPFARALVVHGYPDLALRLLDVVEARAATDSGERPSIELLRLDVAQDSASRIPEPMRRKEALTSVLARRVEFIARWPGTWDAEDCERACDDLFASIGESVAAAIRLEKVDAALAVLRSEGDAIYSRIESVQRKRIAEMRASPSEDDSPLLVAIYNLARTLHLHALIHPPRSERRIGLCNDALAVLGDFSFEGEATLALLYINVETGNCLAEVGKPAEALRSFDQVIQVRESWGDKVKGVWPVTDREYVDLVCEATYRKVLVLGEQKRTSDVLDVARDWFASMPGPWNAPSSIALARELAHAQVATGDLDGALRTARKLIDIDPEGDGAAWGREIVVEIGRGTFK